MSNAIFPAMAGLAWDNTRTPLFNTLVHRAASGREMRMALQAYPLWRFVLKFEVLRSAVAFAELQTLGGFFLARQGQFDSFLYSDPTDNTITDQSIGVGDGVTTQFQLVRQWGSFVEPVMNVNTLTNLKVNGAAQTSPTNYSVNALGMITFVTAPAAAATITWTGSYYYRVRFEQDTAEFNNMMKDLWELQTLAFIGSTGNKV
jgi:uncharacterized protein (TIGR02217 family)